MPICSLPEDATKYSAKITSIYDAGVRRMADNLRVGRIDLGQWHSDMKQAIEQMYIFQAAAAVGGDKGAITDEAMQRIQDNVEHQYDYLMGFAEAIQSADSLDFVANRASMYAQSTQAEFWRQAIEVDIPHVPKDGSTSCLSHCLCSIEVDCDDKGNVLVYWKLDGGEHCPDCEARAAEWNPLIIKRAA